MNKKHIIKESSHEHVLSWDSGGSHCSEPECEVNMKECLDDIKKELILQEEKGNLLNGAGVCLMVLVDRAERILGLLEEKKG